MASSPRLRVLLTTEGTYPHYTGGVSTWCDLLIRGQPDVSFIVWSLMMNPFIKQQFEFPPNVEEFVAVPLWGIEQPAEFTREIPAARVFRSSRRTGPHDIESQFLPMFERLIQTVSSPIFEPAAFAQLLLEMHAYFREFDYRVTWRSHVVWDAFRQHLSGMPSANAHTHRRVQQATDDDSRLVPHWADIRENVRFVLPSRRRSMDEKWSTGAGADSNDGSLEEIATIAEATEALRLLYRLFQTLNVPVPVADITHSAAAAFCAIPAIMAKVERGTPFLLTEHGVYLREQYLAIDRRELPYNLKRLLMDLISAVVQTSYAYADQVSPVCRFNARWETKYGVPDERIRVIYNGVDERTFRPDPAGRSPHPPTVVQVARIDPLKDQITFLRVAEAVHRELPQVRFRHFGPVADDDYGVEVMALHQELGLGGAVTFEGATDDPNGAINAGDVVCLTSISEAFPYTVVESLMCGKPVVSTDVGGVREALDGTGLTAPPRDVDGLAAALLEVLRRPEAERQDISERARQRGLDNFTLARFIDGYGRSYTALFEEAGDAAPSRTGILWEPDVAVQAVPFAGAAVPPATVPERAATGKDEPILVDQLSAMAGDPDPAVREKAVLRAAEVAGGETTILRGLRDDVPWVRRAAVRALGRLGGPSAVRSLSETVRRDPDASVRTLAVATLVMLMSIRGSGGSAGSGDTP